MFDEECRSYILYPAAPVYLASLRRTLVLFVIIQLPFFTPEIDIVSVMFCFTKWANAPKQSEQLFTTM
jgi:hypothetical protein